MPTDNLTQFPGHQPAAVSDEQQRRNDLVAGYFEKFAEKLRSGEFKVSKVLMIFTEPSVIPGGNESPRIFRAGTTTPEEIALLELYKSFALDTWKAGA